MRIINQPLPPDGRARLLKVDPHDHLEIFIQPLGQRGQAVSVIKRGDRIMDRTRPHHHNEAVIIAGKNIRNILPILFNLFLLRLRQRMLGLNLRRTG
ncbi:hypothetical protein GCM10027031_11510 [Corynebacterium atrinae]